MLTERDLIYAFKTGIRGCSVVFMRVEENRLVRVAATAYDHLPTMDEIREIIKSDGIVRHVVYHVDQ